MTVDTRRLSEIYDAALVLAPGERPAFLAKACAGDDALRGEIEARLVEADEASDFLRQLARGMIVDVADAPHVSLEGRRVGAYQVGALIGVGGMGRVYRARDDQLGRDVAIKVLPSVWVSNPDRRARFDREARLLAALNHQNIGGIYGLADADDVRGLVLELVEGPTLTERIAAGPVPVGDALRIARQIADALEAAHEKGIIHRDLKPSNIKITADDAVKVLDFGLAKAVNLEPEFPVDLGTTREGVVLGTVNYMSPEQARGKPIDKRSDIWAFGCVLYEMLTGRRAYAGETASDTISAILEREPDWAALPAATPAPIRRLLHRCLEKSPQLRLRDIGEARIELDQVIAARSSATDAERPVKEDERRRPSRSGALILAIAVILVLAAALAWLSRTRRADESIALGRSHQVTSAPGWEADPALSPDGGLIAYTSDESGNSDIWIVDVHGGNPLRLTTDEAPHSHPAWFPDGGAIAFVRTRGERRSVWKVPRLGGAATLLVDDAFDPAISPDGSRIALSRPGPSGLARIAVAAVADPSQVTFLTRDGDGLWDHLSPSWSPDGQSICYAAHNALWVVSLRGDRPQRLTTEGEYDTDPVWAADGSSIYFSSLREGTEAIWRIPAKGGRPTRVTLGTGPERQPTVSRDGSRIAYSTMTSNSAVGLLDLRNGEERKLSTGHHAFKPSFSPSGSAIVFASDRWGGHFDLWVQLLKGNTPDGAPRRLTEHPGFVNYPAYSPDGQWIAYGRVEGDRREIWMMPEAGGMPVRISDGAAVNIHPAWSPTGAVLAFASERNGVYQIQTVRIAGGQRSGSTSAIVITPEIAMSPTWSPDGRELAYISGGDIWTVRVDRTSNPRRVTSVGGVQRVRWNRTGPLFASGFWGGDRVTMRQLDPRSGTSRPLPFRVILGHTADNVDFDVSSDGAMLAFDQEDLKGDIWVMERDRSH